MSLFFDKSTIVKEEKDEIDNFQKSNDDLDRKVGVEKYFVRESL